jgi:hypothetical protein
VRANIVIYDVTHYLFKCLKIARLVICCVPLRALNQHLHILCIRNHEPAELNAKVSIHPVFAILNRDQLTSDKTSFSRALSHVILRIYLKFNLQSLRLSRICDKMASESA